MRSWLIYIILVGAALAALALLATSFPSVASGVFLIGTPIVVVAAGLGAKFVQRRNKSAHAKTS
ncbi:hypothetical protein [Microbacterium sp. NPDC079176]|uniref:hypothetical protein n=1 Tax=Microbacterium sp. NPDC079176 TaxID=3154768 RepID=UPI0034454453